ncbi:MAG: FAD-dependent oxidoreductase [Firmicutes bacterium]|nr:FAD-dependent oxidoreductase [Bacillota bacterium]
MKIVEQAREIEIIDEVDVCVLGGSSTGVFAAVRAAQMGMRTAIVEKQNSFGGAATSGLTHIWHSIFDAEHSKKIISGLSEMVINRLAERNAVIIHKPTVSSANIMNTEELKIELDILVSEHKIKPYLHTLFSSAITENNNITAVIVENKDGRKAIKAKFFIDCTGDGDLCRRIGIASYTYDTLQPPTTCAKIYGANDPSFSALIREHGSEFGLQKDWGWRNVIPNTDNIKMHAETHVFDVNCAHAGDLTYSEMEGRRQVRAYMDLFRKYVENGEKITLLSLPSYIGVRESYHIKSLHKIKTDDLLMGITYPDAIGNGSYRTDRHHSHDSGITFRYLNGVTETIQQSGELPVMGRWREECDNYPTYYQIPFRSLVPDTKIENILFAGRMIDAEAEAFGALRVMINTNQMGEAVGTAAALAVEYDCPARDINTTELRSRLSDFNAVIL